MYKAFIVVISFIASIDARTVTQTCELNINKDLGSPQPLYFYHNTTEFVTLEDGTNKIILNYGDRIDLYCSEGFRPPFSKTTKKVEALCIWKKRFQILNRTTEMKDVKCVSNQDHTTRMSKRKCKAREIVEIGFDVQGNWLPIYEVCHDNKTGSTHWSHHQLTAHSQQFQRAVARTPFLKGNFYKGISPQKLYTKNVQRKTIAEILGSQKIANELISNNSDLFLARGHMTAKADFIFESAQILSFYFLNVAPQWQTFNDGNWLEVEIGVKKFLEKRNLDAEMYTGVHGVFTYPDVHGKEQEIYLALDRKSGEHRIPVPRFYYKVLIAEEIQAGIVFIGVNHPYLSLDQIKSDYILCPDVSDNVKYINWDRKNITLGYSYACSVEDFTKVVKHLPTLPKVKKLLV